ncbi:hypothetical protein J6590_073990 [Homalodisca vitripennis]|nr:hypothetical protein J6590_073990 [Homalodisca vitripennis]
MGPFICVLGGLQAPEECSPCYREKRKIGQVPGAQSAGTPNDNAQSSSASASATCVEQLSTPCGSTSGKRQKVQLQLFETEETKSLGNADLQRLVLLEQLRLIRMQKEKEKIILAKLKQHEDQQTNVAHGAEKTYFNL